MWYAETRLVCVVNLQLAPVTKSFRVRIGLRALMRTEHYSKAHNLECYRLAPTFPWRVLTHCWAFMLLLRG